MVDWESTERAGDVTNEQWAFCAVLSTGAAIFVVGMVVGALIWHTFLVMWSKLEHEKSRRKQDQMYHSFRAEAKKSNKG